MSVAQTTETPTVEEEGISYLYCNDIPEHDDDDRPVYIGTKRFAGLYCCVCERPLGLSDEKQSKVARAVRKADKNDANVVAKCAQCSASIEERKIIVPCASFDWHIPPHILERLLHYEKAQQSSKKAEKKKDDDDDDSDSSESINSKKKKGHKETLSLQKSARSTTRLPQLSRKGHIEDQYGHEISLQDFFNLIIAPCHVRLYDRIPKHFV